MAVGGAESRQNDLVEALELRDGRELGLELGSAEALLGAGDGKKGKGTDVVWAAALLESSARAPQRAPARRGRLGKLVFSIIIRGLTRPAGRGACRVDTRHTSDVAQVSNVLPIVATRGSGWIGRMG